MKAYTGPELGIDYRYRAILLKLIKKLVLTCWLAKIRGILKEDEY